MATVTSINFHYMQHEHAINARIAGFEDALTWIANGLADKLIDLEGSFGYGPRLERRQIVWLQSQLRGQLNTLGYPDIVAKLVSTYDESALFAQQTLQLLGHPSQMLTPLRSDTLQQLRDLDLTAFEEIGNQAIRVLSREVAMNAIVGTKRSQVIKNLNQVLDSQFVNQGAKYCDTALRMYDRTANFELFQEAGISKYRYWGPKDTVTRPFCSSHVGKTYPLADIQQMSNGTSLGNVMVYGGGYRCRHSWIPVAEIDVVPGSHDAEPAWNGPEPDYIPSEG